MSAWINYNGREISRQAGLFYVDGVEVEPIGRNGDGAKDKVNMIPLGGLGEIGKNMMVFECNDDLLVVDAGLAFPEEEMLGIDIVIPDISYITERPERVRGVVLTHGHEDHIGALPYLLRQLDVPVYGPRLALGLLQEKLGEHGIRLHPKSRPVSPREKIHVGEFSVEFFRVNHSIADCVGLAIDTPAGLIVHTGDFKFDHTPVHGETSDLQKLAALGKRGVLALLSDSTNAEKPGYTQSERVVGETLDRVFRKATNRILVASFASNVPRIQQVLTTAHRYGRKVAVVGRSMENTVEVALNLGYLTAPAGTILPLEEIDRLPHQQVCLLTTGSQGEPMSALTRMSTEDHRRVGIVPGDTVIIAATPVPGNEKLVHRTIDNLFRLGAEVVYGRDSGVHVSGHASQEELKLMINLIRPRFFIPIHGEYRHLVHHARLAESLGIPEKNVLIGENGTIFEFTPDRVRISGKISAGRVLVDGLGVGDVGTVVLRDRKQLSQDGILIVVVAIDSETGVVLSGPDLISRGFVYVRESEKLLEEARQRVAESLATCERKQVTEWSTIKNRVKEALSNYLYEQTRRRPMILPIVMDIAAGNLSKDAAGRGRPLADEVAPV